MNKCFSLAKRVVTVALKNLLSKREVGIFPSERILCSVVIVITLIKIMSEAETELRQRRNLDSQEIEEPIIQDQVSFSNASRAF